jgi:hypothetical protein
MTKKRALIVLACIGVGYGLTLGIHFSRHVRAYCESNSPQGQPEIYVLMDPVYCTWGFRPSVPAFPTPFCIHWMKRGR